MAEIIQLREIQAARERTQRRLCEHRSLERAVTLVRRSLAATAERLEEAPTSEQEELLDRIEKLAAIIRYGMRLLGQMPHSNVPTGEDSLV